MNRERLIEQLKIDEGIIYKIYLDHLGYPTFGIGHLITEDDPEYGMPVGYAVSEERCIEAFQKDLDKAIKNAKDLYGEIRFDSFPEEVQEILVNMIFNLGKGGLSKFKKFRTALEMRDWKEAAAQGRDSLWYRQVTNRAERLMSRLENLA